MRYIRDDDAKIYLQMQSTFFFFRQQSQRLVKPKRILADQYISFDGIAQNTRSVASAMV